MFNRKPSATELQGVLAMQAIANALIEMNTKLDQVIELKTKVDVIYEVYAGLNAPK